MLAQRIQARRALQFLITVIFCDSYASKLLAFLIGKLFYSERVINNSLKLAPRNYPLISSANVKPFGKLRHRSFLKLSIYVFFV